MANIPDHDRDIGVQRSGNDVKQTAVKVEIAVVKSVLVFKAGLIPVEQHLAVSMLHILVVADAMLAESEGYPNDERQPKETYQPAIRGS